METVGGVGAVTLVGGQRRAINVELDTDKLTAYQLSAEDVRQAFMRQNIELPGGRVDQGSEELILRTMGRMERAEDFSQLIVADRNAHPVRIEDVAQVFDSHE